MYKVVLSGIVSDVVRTAYFEYYSDATSFVEMMSPTWKVELISGMIAVEEKPF
jgi:hypothetical protein